MTSIESKHSDTDESKQTRIRHISTRHSSVDENELDPKVPRLGRRESEPHSIEINYLYDVLNSNYPDDRVIWDLHHYFHHLGEEIDLQYDISFFRGLKIPYTLSSFRSELFDGRKPTMAINIFSKSTWKNDLGLNMDTSRILEIPLYILFSPYLKSPKTYKAPFLRAYILKKDGDYHVKETRDVCLKENGLLDDTKLIDVGDIVPFQFGIMKVKQRHEGDLPLYHLILVDSRNKLRLLTSLEKEKERADKEKERADKEKKRADKEKERTDRLEEKLKSRKL